jgi:hypothetical protein
MQGHSADLLGIIEEAICVRNPRYPFPVCLEAQQIIARLARRKVDSAVPTITCKLATSKIDSGGGLIWSISLP